MIHQRFGQCRRKWDDTLTRSRLGKRPKGHCGRCLDRDLCDLESSPLKVDRSPGEPGALTPPESGHGGVSRIVVRQAVDILRNEGLVVSQRGSGTFVREQQERTRRVLGDLYAHRAYSSPFAAAARAAGMSPEWEYQTRRTTAPQAIAERLRIAAGDEVMRTNYRFFADDQPVTVLGFGKTRS
jgi:GntR family transcriptional regulator